MKTPRRTIGTIALAGWMTALVGQCRAENEPGLPGVVIYIDVNFDSSERAEGSNSGVWIDLGLPISVGTSTSERGLSYDNVGTTFTDSTGPASAPTPKFQELFQKGKVVNFATVIPNDGEMTLTSPSNPISEPFQLVSAEPVDSAGGQRDHQSWSDIMTFPMPQTARDSSPQEMALDSLLGNVRSDSFASGTLPGDIASTDRLLMFNVPEPTTISFACISGMGLLAARRRARRVLNRSDVSLNLTR